MKQKEKWEAVIKDCEKSGLSQSKYARQIGINESRLRYWKKKLAKGIENGEVGNFIKISGEEKIEIIIGEVIIKAPISVSGTKLAELVKCLN